MIDLYTEARRVDILGHILDNDDDSADENAVMVRGLGWGCRAWQHEAEAECVGPLVAVPQESRAPLESAILAWLAEHHEGRACDIGRAMGRLSTVESVTATLSVLWRKGKVWRVGRGRYRLA